MCSVCRFSCPYQLNGCFVTCIESFGIVDVFAVAVVGVAAVVISLPFSTPFVRCQRMNLSTNVYSSLFAAIAHLAYLNITKRIAFLNIRRYDSYLSNNLVFGFDSKIWIRLTKCFVKLSFV